MKLKLLKANTSRSVFAYLMMFYFIISALLITFIANTSSLFSNSLTRYTEPNAPLPSFALISKSSKSYLSLVFLNSTGGYIDGVDAELIIDVGMILWLLTSYVTFLYLEFN